MFYSFQVHKGAWLFFKFKHLHRRLHVGMIHNIKIYSVVYKERSSDSEMFTPIAIIISPVFILGHP